jgi:hypothetical protein
VRVLLVGLLRRRLGAASLLLLRLRSLTAHHCAVNDSATQARQNRRNRGEEGGTLTAVGKGGEGDKTMATTDGALPPACVIRTALRCSSIDWDLTDFRGFLGF